MKKIIYFSNIRYDVEKRIRDAAKKFSLLNQIDRVFSGAKSSLVTVARSQEQSTISWL